MTGPDEAARPRGDAERADDDVELGGATGGDRSTPPLLLTVGAGVRDPQGRRLELGVGATGPAAALRDALASLPAAPESWISGHTFAGDRRSVAAWQGAQVLAVDVDYHDADGEHAPLPRGVADAIELAFECGAIAGSIAHVTPRGVRVFVVLDRPVTDPATARRAIAGAVALVDASLARLGADGLRVDRSALDLARLCYLPNAVVGGVERRADVVLLRREPYAIGDLVAAAPAPTPSAAPEPRQGRPVPRDVLDALDQIPADDYQTWIAVGCALRHEYGDLAFSVWDDWSRTSAKYPCVDPNDPATGEQSTAAKWQTFTPRGAGSAGLETLRRLAREHGAPVPAGVFSALPVDEAAPPAPTRTTRPRALTPGDVIDGWRRRGPVVHEPTGLDWLDERTGGGLPYGTRVFVVGAPDAGKSAIVVEIADNLASRGVPVGLLAIDEEPGDVLTRFAQRRGVARDQVERLDGLDALADALAELPLRLFGAGWSIEAAAADLAATRGRGLLVVDSVQTAESERERPNDSLRERVNARVAALRAAGDEHGHITLATSEMSRAHYANRRQADDMDPLGASKESGSIEYSARLLLALRSEPGGVVRVETAKNKLGDTGDPVFLRLDRERQRFTPAVGYVPPDGDARSTQRARDRAAADAAHVAATIGAEPGIGARELRAAVRTRASMSSSRVDVALRRLGAAVVVREGPRAARWHFLDGSAVPDDVLARIADDDERARAVAARPPAAAAEGVR